MAFFASLVAYMASVAGIVLAFVMSYTFVFETPEQPPAAPKIVAPTPASRASAAPVAAADTAPKVRPGQWGPPVVHRAAGSPVPQTNVAAAAPRKPAARVAARRQPLDLRNFTRLWAYQPTPGVSNAGALGYANEASDRNNRSW